MLLIRGFEDRVQSLFLRGEVYGTTHLYSGQEAVSYFGDGAANQAYFFECLNFAKVLQLPVVFVCENNGYGEYTPFELVTPGGILPRAAAMQIPTRQIDGMDIRAVRFAALELVE